MAKQKKTSDNEPGNMLRLEDAMAELGQIVSLLESGQGTLDESLAHFERGMALLRVCNQQLDTAAQRIEIVTQLASDGTVVTEVFDATATIQKSVSVESSTAVASRPSGAARKTPKDDVVDDDDEDEAGLLF